MNQPQLTRPEWTAVKTALDAVEGCAAPGPLARLTRRLGGGPQPEHRADPRLDAVRRFVCATRLLRRPAEELVPEVLAHGFSRPQVEALALLSR